MCVGFELRYLKFQEPFKTMEEMTLFKKCSFSIKQRNTKTGNILDTANVTMAL